jgi:N-acetylmuramoyl-L-alanine amidase
MRHAVVTGLVLLLASATGPAKASTDVELLARTVWAEARSEGEAGMAAVAWVVKNRKNVGLWGSSVETIIKRRRQFAVWGQGDRNHRRMLTVGRQDKEFVDALRIVADVLQGRTPDPTGGATHYHAGRPPYWAKRLVFTVRLGRHRFYRLAR